MTQNDLREKVINAEAKVAKRKAVLKKHREQLAKLIQKGAGETLPNQRPGQNDRPQTTKGAKP